MAFRRSLLKAGAAGAGLAAFAAGTAETGRRLVSGLAAPRPAGRAPAPEAVVDPLTGEVTPNPEQYVAQTLCQGCGAGCGLRVRVERATGRVLRVGGNPWHPLVADPPLPDATTPREALRLLSRHHETGLTYRATLCGRGAALPAQAADPGRVLTPLKRVGPRHAGRWQAISLEQLIREVVEGGDLFGEGPVAGLRALRDDAPIDPARPHLGPRANQFAWLGTAEPGRLGLVRRFVRQGFGSVNLLATDTSPSWPDIGQAAYVIVCGGGTGDSFRPMLRRLAAGRATGRLDYVVAAPVLGTFDNAAAGAHAGWLPIRPGTELALALGMIGCIIAQGRYDAEYLSRPHAAAGTASFSNATHLVICEPGHPREGSFLRASDLGHTAADEDDPCVVEDAADGTLRPATVVPRAALFVDRRVGGLRIRSSLDLLRESTQAQPLAAFAAICGVPAEALAALARDFTSHGRRAVMVPGISGTANGSLATFALMTLNTLIGNIGSPGGMLPDGDAFPAEAAGPRYDLATFPGMRVASGVVSSAVPAEWLAASLQGTPYPLGALVLWGAPPLDGTPGLRAALARDLADPKKLPLIVAIDRFADGSSAFADYIVPDSMGPESWGWAARTHTAGWPVVSPRTATSADGAPVTLESFLIGCAKALGLPGFGTAAIRDAAGAAYPLVRAADWYLRAGANIAFAAPSVPDAGDDDLWLTGLDRLRPELEATLKPGEWRKVAGVLARGGRFADPGTATAVPRQVNICHENLTCPAGVPRWVPPSFADGTALQVPYPPAQWPFLLVSQQDPVPAAGRTVLLHQDDAARLGLGSGDTVLVETPDGRMTGTAVLRAGIMRGVIALAGDDLSPGPGLRDPTRTGESLWVDPASGSVVRQGLPARVMRA
ncbi:molybdopterin dinucleotide binding domain-containing protein [Rhodovastum atsumiense]|uniref:Molybdopterin-dependent oxidoreductase n=1 Tax=Rhodovastum atsumiense TaxID=504468 RepID=A0A5M6IN76_9PROT|nr:molybdopterin dinucleotide binding domain-containing protein [Rhodovastum atsumiense]KAA5609720.1 molybdopterin-dependent oxidoreductase [Rhodovastum atsumiense]